MTNPTNKLVRNTISYLPVQFITPATQFAVTIIWTHLLDPRAFGVVAFVLAAQEAVGYVAVSWWSLFMIRFRERYALQEEERFRDMDKRVVAVSVVILLLLTDPVLALIGLEWDTPLFMASASYFILRSLLMHYSEWARSEHQIAVYSTAQITSVVLGSALSLCAIAAIGPSPAAVIAAQAIGQLVAMIMLGRQTGLRAGFGVFDHEIFADAIRYCSPLIVAGISSWIAPNGIRVLVQHWEGAVGLGLLSVGWGLGQRIAGVLAMLFTAAAYPLAVTQIESGDRRAALTQVSLNGVFLFSILAPATVGAELLSQPLVDLMIAPEFRDMTITLLPIAILGASIRAIRVHVSDQAMLLVEKTGAAMNISVFDAAASMVFCAIGVHFGGVVGAAAGVVVGTTLSAIASFGLSVGALGLPFPAPWMLVRIVLATAVMGEVLTLTTTPVGIVAVASRIALGVAIYGSMIVVLFPQCRGIAGRLLMRASGMMRRAG